MSDRHLARVADRVRRVLAEAVRAELHDPRLALVAVTDVRLSPDLQHAVAYVSLMGDTDESETLRSLNRAAPFLRRKLAQRAGLRHTPELRFVVDDALERGLRLEQIFEGFRANQPESADES